MENSLNPRLVGQVFRQLKEAGVKTSTSLNPRFVGQVFRHISVVTLTKQDSLNPRFVGQVFRPNALDDLGINKVS